MSWSLDGRPVKRVLVSRLRYLGDVVMSTVVVDLLREGDPDLRIGYLCEDAHAPAVMGHRAVDRLHILAANRSGRDAAARHGVAETRTVHRGGWLRTAVSLRRERYDLAVDLFFNPRSAWLLRAGGARARITGRRNRRAKLYTHVAERRADADFDRLAPGGLGEHVARLTPLTHVESGLSFRDWFVARGTAVAPSLTVDQAADSAAGAALAAAGAPDGPFVVAAPGATWQAKSWPAERWKELFDRFGQYGIGVVALTPPGPDRGFAAACADAPAIVLPPLPLSTVFGVLNRGRGTVAVDGGVMHASVALGRPTVAIFGPTDPDIWFPYDHLGPHRLMATRPHCHPCDLHECDEWICMPDVQADDVAAALAGALTGGGAS